MAYVLLCVDVYSRYVFLYAIENKGKEEMARVLKLFIAAVPPHSVKNVQTDRGKLSSWMSEWLEE